MRTGRERRAACPRAHSRSGNEILRAALSIYQAGGGMALTHSELKKLVATAEL
ncbi:LysR family transcriptional regulator, partial [Burkholderia pseudomallei]